MYTRLCGKIFSTRNLHCSRKSNKYDYCIHILSYKNYKIYSIREIQYKYSSTLDMYVCRYPSGISLGEPRGKLHASGAYMRILAKEFT